MKLQAKISKDLLQRVKANISEMDDVALMYAGIQAFREATPELRQRAKNVPQGGDTVSFEFEIIDEIYEAMLASLDGDKEPATLVHMSWPVCFCGQAMKTKLMCARVRESTPRFLGDFWSKRVSSI